MAATDATMDDAAGAQPGAATGDAPSNIDEFEQQLIANGKLFLVCF